MVKVNVLRHFGLVWAGMCLLNSANAATYQVNSIAALQTRINAAAPGDRIIVADGTYTTSAAISVNRTATAVRPIVIEAATIGGVTIAGSHGFTLDSPAAHILIRGFRFTHASGRNTINSGAAFCHFSRNIFKCSGQGPYLLVAGHNTRIERNEFHSKSTIGNMIDVRGVEGQVAKNVWIHHNYFHDFTNARGNGAETIRFGLSGLSMSTGNGIVEYNLFVRCRGENELISNKSCGNTYRYNTFMDSPGAQLTLRHGNDCLAYGNYFRNTDGLRIFGDRQQVFSNYFEDNTKGVDMGNGGGQVADGAELTTHDRPDECVVAFNTFINNKVHYQMGGRRNGMGAANITVARNIFVGGENLAAIDKSAPYTGLWKDNIAWNCRLPQDIPADGLTVVDPALVRDDNGIFRLQKTSAAVDAAAGSFSFVVADMDGQPRQAPFDTGADEISDAPVCAGLLSINDVGPFSALSDTKTSEMDRKE